MARKYKHPFRYLSAENGGMRWFRSPDRAREERATRAWFAGREAGWTPAERVRRAAANASEIWAL